MGIITTIIFIVRTLNIFFLFYILLNNCSIITTNEFYKSIFYIDLAYRFIAFVSTFIITFWKKCLKKFQLIVLILLFLNYIFYFLGVISLITNFLKFNSYYYDCPYLRFDNENIINSDTYKYKRACLNYETNSNNNINQYICFYNSTDEYIHKYCDNLLCKKNKDNSEVINNINCEKINYNYITEIKDNIKNGIKLLEHIDKSEYKNELFLCKRKTEINKKNKLIGNKCPDENPIKSYIFGIYEYICSYFIECLFFIYLYFYLKKNRKILEIKLLKEKKRRESEQNNNYEKSGKDRTTNTENTQNNNENTENEYNQGDYVLTIGIEQENNNKVDIGSKSLSDIKNENSYRNKDLKETNSNLIKIKKSFNQDIKNENNVNNKSYHHNPNKIRNVKRLLYEESNEKENDINKDEGTKEENL